jgi:prolyl oligopeptidase PreP (S9A serine peptidase family)
VCFKSNGGRSKSGECNAGRPVQRHSFADWAACIRKLHAARYSSPGMTAARGASAGGLLTAAGCMLYPGLVKSAILRVVCAIVPAVLWAP